MARGVVGLWLGRGRVVAMGVVGAVPSSESPSEGIQVYVAQDQAPSEELGQVSGVALCCSAQHLAT